MVNVKFSSPSAYCKCTAIESKWSRINRRSPICSLFFSCSPATIMFAVAFVVVDSVKSCAAWTGEHVFGKVFKFLPTLTNSYSSSAVVSIITVVFVLTTCFHAAPQPVIKTRGSAMFTRGISNTSGHVTTTTAGFTTAKASRAHPLFGSAFTMAEPFRTKSPIGYLPTTKLFTSKFYDCFAHVDIIHLNAPEGI